MLIVIVIIGILAAALIPRLTGAQGQARDTARVSDLSQMGTALTVYGVDNNNSYPISGSSEAVLSGLVTDGYLKALPKDPLNGVGKACAITATTWYYGFSNKWTWYVVGAKMETKKSNSLNANCSDTIQSTNTLLTGVWSTPISSTVGYYLYTN